MSCLVKERLSPDARPSKRVLDGTCFCKMAKQGWIQMSWDCFGRDPVGCSVSAPAHHLPPLSKPSKGIAPQRLNSWLQ